MWPRKGRVPPEAAVVATAEALLAGRAAEAYRVERLAVPPWALVNALAHASPQSLRALAETDGGGSAGAALGRLAAAVLALGPGPEEVVACQRELLVPVELILLGSGVSARITDAQLEAMLNALLACRRERREREARPES